MSSSSGVPLMLSAASPLWRYGPLRDGPLDQGWNAGYSGNLDAENGRDQSAVGIPIRRTLHAGSTIELPFTGHGATLCFTPGSGAFKITVDGLEANASQVTAAADSTVCHPDEATPIQRAFTVSGLDGTKSHLVQLEVTNAPDAFVFYGGQFELPAEADGRAANNLTSIADDSSNWQLLPGGRGANQWDFAVVPGLEAGRATFNCQYRPETRAIYNFTDSVAVVLAGNRWPDAHSYSVILDGITTKLDATGSWNDGSTVIFAQGGLDPKKQYTLEVVNYNEDDPDCKKANNACCVSVDELLLLHVSGDTAAAPVNIPEMSGQHNATDHHPHSNSKTVGIAVGGTIAGVIAIIAALVFGVVCWRRQQRRRRWSKNESTVDLDAYTLHPGSTPGTYTRVEVDDPERGQYATINPFTGPLAAPPSSFGSETTSTPSTHSSAIAPGAFAPVIATGDRKDARRFQTGNVAPPTAPPGVPEVGGHLPTPNAPFSARPMSTSTGSVYSQDAGTMVSRLNRDDMEEVLQFVASRINTPGHSKQPSDPFGDDALPQYSQRM
jgi:hypothetical protein